MFGIAGEFITGFALGVEWVSKGDLDDFSYFVLELGIIRLVFTFE